jgi:hypothetical protein
MTQPLRNPVLINLDLVRPQIANDLGILVAYYEVKKNLGSCCAEVRFGCLGRPEQRKSDKEAQEMAHGFLTYIGNSFIQITN